MSWCSCKSWIVEASISVEVAFKVGTGFRHMPVTVSSSTTCEELFIFNISPFFVAVVTSLES